MAQQGKNKRRQIEAYDEIHNVTLSVDSAEECDTLAWLVESKKLNLINDFSYQPASFKLSNAVTYQDIDNKTKTLFREHTYTADWCLEFTPSACIPLAKELKVPYEALSCDSWKVYIDSKGTFNVTERAFGYNQKWLWQHHNVYVYKLVPKKFFAKMGVPEACKMTKKTKKPRKMFLGYASVEDVFKDTLKASAQS